MVGWGSTYGPIYQAVTRAQMASFLARALKLTAVPNGPFVDLGTSPHTGDINAIAAATGVRRVQIPVCRGRWQKA